MKRVKSRSAAPRRAAVVVFVPVALVAWAGCALVINLGDESKLRAADAGTDANQTSDVVDAGGSDAAPDAQGEGLVCGLKGSTNLECRTCVQTGSPNCCEESKACGADPDCVARLECVKDCMVQFFCISECLGSSQTIQGVTFCTQTNCPKCVPKTACEHLGRCGILIHDAGPDLIIRQQVRNIILDVDEEACTAQHRVMFNYSDAAVCQCNDAGVCP